MTQKTNITDSEVRINMESIEVVCSVIRASPENLPRSLQLISSETRPIFEKRDSDTAKPSQSIPKATLDYTLELSSPVRNISDEAAAIQNMFKSEHPSCQLRSSAVSGNTYVKAMPDGIVPNAVGNRRDRGNKEKANNFAYFKTRSGNLERKLSRLLSPQERDNEVVHPQDPEIESLPARRFFDALQGPELEILRDSEELVISADKLWPFLLRFPISCFGICLGVGSQAILWKTLAATPSMEFLHVPEMINLVLWCLGLVTLIIIFVVYTLKCIFYFEAVRIEYYHPVRVNFFFAPWIACMFLALGVPPNIAKSTHPFTWCGFMFPVLCLELKIYGQWMLGGRRRLSEVANPTNYLAIVGNFVGALLGAETGWKEAAIFTFAVGLAHYMVLFVTLYQRLPTIETLPNELHPVVFLFVATPSIASVAWERIRGDFDYFSRIAYFIALFLYISLVVRLNFFRGFRFSIAWWAYTFPLTSAAVATIKYSNEVRHPFTQYLAVTLTAISSLTVFSLSLITIWKASVWGALFPNDASIAITDKTEFEKNQEVCKKQEGYDVV